jgi:hypothetical protein
VSAIANQTLTIPQGTTWSQVVVWKVGQPPVAVNLAGFSARMQIRTGYATPSAAIELSTSNGRISLNAGTGVITLSLSATETATLEAGRYVYDLEMTSSGGEVTRLLGGMLIVSPEVTR